MSEKKGWGSRALGLFVVREEGADSAENAGAPGAPGSAEAGEAGTAGDAGAAGPDASQPGAAGAAGEPGAAAAFVTAPPAAPGGEVDFAAVYAAAGIDAEEQGRVAKAAELLHALPAGSDPARQIVEASLKAFGVAVDKILAAGEREIRALDAYVAAGAADTRQVLADSQQRIAQYEQEMQRIRQVMDQRVAEQQAVERSCAAGKQQVSQVLEFFGHAPAGTPLASPASLHEPPARPASPTPSPNRPSERSS
jgi:hypothetical protein